MSKTLELTIHDRNDDGDYLSAPTTCGRQYVIASEDVEVFCMQQRFTDAELAAELFRQTAWLGAIGRTYATGEGRNILIEAAFTFGPVTRDEHEWMTVKRFATLPHYDEEQS